MYYEKIRKYEVPHRLFDFNMTLKPRTSWAFSKVVNRNLIVSIRSAESIRIDSANEWIRIANRPALNNVVI